MTANTQSSRDAVLSFTFQPPESLNVALLSLFTGGGILLLADGSVSGAAGCQHVQGTAQNCVQSVQYRCLSGPACQPGPLRLINITWLLLACFPQINTICIYDRLSVDCHNIDIEPSDLSSACDVMNHPHFCVSVLQLMEEYDWGEFAVITSLLPGYDTFVDIVESYTDTSYFLWKLQDVLSLEMSVGANDGKTKRMLQQVQWDEAVRVVDYVAPSLTLASFILH